MTIFDIEFAANKPGNSDYISAKKKKTKNEMKTVHTRNDRTKNKQLSKSKDKKRKTPAKFKWIKCGKLSKNILEAIKNEHKQNKVK